MAGGRAAVMRACASANKTGSSSQHGHFPAARRKRAPAEGDARSALPQPLTAALRARRISAEMTAPSAQSVVLQRSVGGSRRAVHVARDESEEPAHGAVQAAVFTRRIHASARRA
jgi:hypothetical protein